MNLSELIKSRREAHNMSLQDVADACGVTKGYVWEIEQGKSLNPSLSVAIRLSLCLGISINALAAATLENKP